MGIFEELGDPNLYEYHDHVLRLMEKFLFIAAPIHFPGEMNDEQVDEHYFLKLCSHLFLYSAMYIVQSFIRKHLEAFN